MRRSFLLVTAGLFLACGLSRGADPVPPSGYWKINLPAGDGSELTLMVAFTEQDGKWIGDYLTASQELRIQPKFKSLKVAGDHVQFSLEFSGRDFVSFDGLLAKDKKKLSGSMSLLGEKLTLVDLHPTKLKKLDDPFELARETLTQIEGGPQMFEAAFRVVEKAGAKKMPVDDVRAVIDRVNKAATAYGPRWEREVTLRLAEALAGQDGLGEVAVAQAKRAERLLTDDDDPATRMKVLEAVARSLSRAGKPDDAKPYTAQISKLEARDYAEYAKTLPFKPEAFTSRKAKSDRAVLVEIFTGAECPPCVAVDLAFDGLLKAYKPADVILMQYHVHIPGPDPLTSPEAMKRLEEYYADQVRGAPTVFISGKLGEGGGGPAAAAEKKYTSFRKQIEEGLEKPAGVKLGLSIAKGEKGGFTAKAAVSDLEMPGEKMMLRFALAEERIRYTGGNGVRYHHMVVRSMPGGAKGIALPQKSAEHSVNFDPDAVRADLTKYLDAFAKSESPFPRPDRPLALKNLKLIAFVQNDATREILHAAQVDVP
jgi:hypothetical protein